MSKSTNIYYNKQYSQAEQKKTTHYTKKKLVFIPIKKYTTNI